MLEVGENYKKIIQTYFSDHIMVVNFKTFGFETLIKINFFNDRRSWKKMNQPLEERENEIYIRYCIAFKNFIYEKIFNDHEEMPLIGFVHEYKFKSEDISLPCFLLYPMSVYTTNDDIISALNIMLRTKAAFENVINGGHEIEMDKVSALKPPR